MESNSFFFFRGSFGNISGGNIQAPPDSKMNMTMLGCA